MTFLPLTVNKSFSLQAKEQTHNLTASTPTSCLCLNVFPTSITVNIRFRIFVKSERSVGVTYLVAVDNSAGCRIHTYSRGRHWICKYVFALIFIVSQLKFIFLKDRNTLDKREVLQSCFFFNSSADYLFTFCCHCIKGSEGKRQLI